MRGRFDGWCRQDPQFLLGHGAGVRPATVLVLLLSTVTGADLFTEPYLLTGGGPNGASSSPMLMLYQRGIEQGSPDTAAAIGVILRIGIPILAFVQHRLAGGDES